MRHLLNVCYRLIHLRLYSCSVAYAQWYSWHPGQTTSIVYTLTKSTVTSKCHRVVIGLLPIGLCVVLMITEDYMFTLSVGLKTKIDFGSHWWRGSQLPPPQLPTSTSAVGSCSSVPLHFYLLMQKIFPENYQGQVERPLLSSASQARCSTNDSTALCQTISNNLCTD